VQTYLLGCCKTHSIRSTVPKSKKVKQETIDLTNIGEEEKGVEHAFSRFKQVRMVCMRMLESESNWGQHLPVKEPAKGSKENLTDKFKPLFFNRVHNSPSVKVLFESIKNISPNSRKGVTIKDYENLLISLILLAAAEEESFSVQIDSKTNVATLDQNYESLHSNTSEQTERNSASTNTIVGCSQEDSNITIVKGGRIRSEEILPQKLNEEDDNTLISREEQTIPQEVGDEQVVKDTVEEEEYEVEKIIRKRIKGKAVEYLVRWKGYSSVDDCWVVEKDLACPELISVFNKTPTILERPKRKHSKSRTTKVIKNKKNRK
ncbi:hypothetical protein HDV02_000821, partial [Globomyces sp. JEL0801]